MNHSQKKVHLSIIETIISMEIYFTIHHFHQLFWRQKKNKNKNKFQFKTKHLDNQNETFSMNVIVEKTLLEIANRSKDY